MEKKNNPVKKPTQLDIKKMVAAGNLAEKAYKKDNIEKLQEQENISVNIEELPELTNRVSIEQPIKELLSETVNATNIIPPVMEKSKDLGNDKQSEEEQQKNMQEQLVPTQDVPFEVFLKKYLPANTDRRETVQIYTTNLKILKAIATSEDAPIIDIANNIIAEWAKKYSKNIRKSLQKPSKMFGL